MKKSSTEIVILGGGYVAVLAYKSFASRMSHELKKGTVRITVVCPLLNHTFHGFTCETLTGILQTKNQLSPLTEVMPAAHQLTGQAQEVDTNRQIVKVCLETGIMQELYYDHLLLGYGSFDSEKIEGLSTYGYQIKSPIAFYKTREKILDLVEKAAQKDQREASEMLTFVIGGGGFTGVELAANISEFVNHLKESYPALDRVLPGVKIIDSGDLLLKALPDGCDRLRNYTLKVLHEQGIEVLYNRRIRSIDATGLYLDDQSYLPASMVISTVGQSRISLRGTRSMQRDESGRICTNQFLQVIGHDNIWGGGDACHVIRHKTEMPCPANALWAIEHGKHIGKNMANAMLGRTLKPFTFRGLGEAASLGIGKGIGELYGFQFTGTIAWVLRWMFFHYFIPSKKVMMRAMGDWMFLLFSGKRRGLLHAGKTGKPSGKFLHNQTKKAERLLTPSLQIK